MLGGVVVVVDVEGRGAEHILPHLYDLMYAMLDDISAFCAFVLPFP